MPLELRSDLYHESSSGEAWSWASAAVDKRRNANAIFIFPNSPPWIEVRSVRDRHRYRRGSWRLQTFFGPRLLAAPSVPVAPPADAADEAGLLRLANGLVSDRC